MKMETVFLYIVLLENGGSLHAGLQISSLATSRIRMQSGYVFSTAAIHHPIRSLMQSNRKVISVCHGRSHV